MSHGDYNCCAVCDCKMAFSIEATSKEEVCSSCVAYLAELGVTVHNVEELMDWMRSADPSEVMDTLNVAGFSRCLYPNPVDDECDRIQAMLPGRKGQV